MLATYVDHVDTMLAPAHALAVDRLVSCDPHAAAHRANAHAEAAFRRARKRAEIRLAAVLTDDLAVQCKATYAYRGFHPQGFLKCTVVAKSFDDI